MEDRSYWLWRGARPLIGTVVGVGIFGLPYVFAKAGFALGTLELIAVALVSLIALYMYGDLLLAKPGHRRFIGIVDSELGLLGKWAATLTFFGSYWGAMLAYLIVGGSFAFTVFAPLFGGQKETYQYVFWLMASLAVIGGPLLVRRLQGWLIPIFFTLMVALVLFSLPHMEAEFLLAWHPESVALPFGALLFAFSGFGAVAEAKEALGRQKRFLRPAITWAMFLVAVVYLLFTVVVVGLTGPATTPIALDGLTFIVGRGLVTLVAVIGLMTVFTAYMTLGDALLNTLLSDFRGRFISSWWLIVVVPLVLFVSGATDFLRVIGWTGGVLGALSGILLILTYERARFSARSPKRTFNIAQPLVGLSFLAFVAMLFITIIS